MLITTSCFKEPNYSNTPTLRFNRFELSNNQFVIDGGTGFIYFDFTDGDGDLGLINTIIDGIDTTLTGKVIVTLPKYENIFPKTSTLLFPEITNSNDVFPKKGELRIKVAGILDQSSKFFYAPFIGKDSDTLTLSVSIIDRAGNISNTVITPEFIVKIN